MLLPFKYFLITISIAIGLIYFSNWIKEEHPRLRPIWAVIFSSLSAYSASFLFDIIIQWINGDLTFKNILLPVFTWTGVSMTLYIIAKKLATNKIQIGAAFYIIGIIALIAAFVGHFFNIYVGALMLLIGFSTNFIDSLTCEEYLERGLAKTKINHDYQGAIKDFDKALVINPNYLRAYFSRGFSKNKIKDFKGAIMDYSMVIQLNPKFAEAYVGRGIVKGKTQDYKGAIEDFNKAIEINPKYADSYFGRGIAKINLGQKEAGFLDLSKAGELGYKGAYDAIKENCN